jgi:pyruvate/2-oxoglutarate dehydrogenase complex dihydrolipoamide acyltransferase (E2) component
MSFFVKACVNALKEVPAVNAEIDGQDIIYKNFYDIGVAVGTEKGLVVPVVRDSDDLSLAGIEKAIANLGKKARDGELTIGDMQGGTFTISNGGIYGSLMSTRRRSGPGTRKAAAASPASTAPSPGRRMTRTCRSASIRSSSTRWARRTA